MGSFGFGQSGERAQQESGSAPLAHEHADAPTGTADGRIPAEARIP